MYTLYIYYTYIYLIPFLETNKQNLFLNITFLQLLMMELLRHKGFFFHLRRYVWIGKKHKVLELACTILATRVFLMLLYSV